MKYRPAIKLDIDSIVPLIISTSKDYFKYLFGEERWYLLNYLCSKPNNYFSYQRVWIAEDKEQIVGMVLFYDYIQKKKQGIYGDWLIFKYFKWGIFKRVFRLLKAQRKMGDIKEGDMYLSNIAVYSHYQGQGIGKKLLEIVEKEARLRGNKRIMLEVAKDNKKAMTLYLKIGYKYEKTIVINKDFTVFQLIKEL